MSGWGGARTNAGRPAKGPHVSEPHKTRPSLAPRHPVHVRARFVRGIRRIPRRRAYAALRRALSLSLARDDFRIVHFAVLANRLELVVEASDQYALARGMQGFQVSAARWLNRAARRHGGVFPDRYRMAILRTRSAVRAIAQALPLGYRIATPETWLVRIELEPRVRARRWLRSRADEDS
jgi:hypothetical protein